MISKIGSTKNFDSICRYVCCKPGAEVLAVCGVRGHDHGLMKKDFEFQAADRPGKTNVCFHASLSFHKQDKPSDELMERIGKQYLLQLGIVDTQFAIVKHTDRPHPHIHIIANMVNNRARSISDSNIRIRGKKIAQALTKEYRLKSADVKRVEQTNMASLNAMDAARYKIYNAIANHLPTSHDLDDLVLQLKKEKIETVFKMKGQTNERQGISFKLGQFCFKGSEVARIYSLGNLDRAFTAMSKSKWHRIHLDAHREQVESPLRIDSPGFQLHLMLMKVLQDLLSPVSVDSGAGAFLAELNRSRRKRKRRSLGHRGP